MLLKKISIIVLLLPLLLPTAVYAQEDTAPANDASVGVAETPPYFSVVETLHAQLLHVMKNAESLGYHGRYDSLEPVVTRAFDTPLISKVILSRYWNELDEAQRREFIDLFNRLTVATYASRFDDYAGETFKTITSEELKRGRLLVKTELQRSGKSPISLDYLMHEDNDTWWIISVIADGINDLSLKRAEYATVIRDKGYNGLVDELRGKIRDMEQGN